MTRNLSGVALIAALLMAGVSATAIVTPALAQDDYGDASFDSFHDELSNYGDWIYSDRWGEVWIPNTDNNFSPYNTNGYWAYTNDYGWTWVSGYQWGDIPFHYGRWVNDPDDGWLWIPGYVWSPAWVAWRSNGSYIGWMPLPPDDGFLEGGEQYGDNSIHIGIDFNDAGGFYGYGRWYGGYDDRRFAANWVFVNPGHMGDRQFHRFAAPVGSNTVIIRNTQNITNYTVVDNYVVNRSVNINVVNRAGGHVRPVDAGSVVRNRALITSFSAGRATQIRIRAVNPHGTGTPFSAPKPSDRIVKTLSARVPPKLSGRPGNAHLFTRDTVTAAPLPPKRGGLPAGVNGPPGALDRGPGASGRAVMPPASPPDNPKIKPVRPRGIEPVAPDNRGPTTGEPNDNSRRRDRSLAPEGPLTPPAATPTDRGIAHPVPVVPPDQTPREHAPRTGISPPNAPDDAPLDRRTHHNAGGEPVVPAEMPRTHPDVVAPVVHPNVAPPMQHPDMPRVTPPVPHPDQTVPPDEKHRDDRAPRGDTGAPVHHDDDKNDHGKPPKNDDQGQ